MVRESNVVEVDFNGDGKLDLAVTMTGDNGSFSPRSTDQANVLLPQSLAGSGVSSVVLTIGDTAANTVYLTIQ